jgi:methyl-accepting chemotaxis protein WspA
MRNWSIRSQILLGFGLVLLAISLMGVNAFVTMSRMVQLGDDLQRNAISGLQEGEAMRSAWFGSYLLAQQYAYQQDRGTLTAVGQRLRERRRQLDEATTAYQGTLSDAQDHARFEAFERAAAAYRDAEDSLIAEAPARASADNRAALTDRLAPRFADVNAAINAIDEWNQSAASAAARQISASMHRGRDIIVISLLAVALICALACGYLWRAITRPLSRLIRSTELVSGGDFTQRVNLVRHDEFGALGTAFDRMVGDLTVLVDQIQKSSIQVNTAVTQIGATASEQQATATEIAATTTEIGATSKEISATSRELVHTMSEVADVAGQAAGVAGDGQAGLVRMGDTMHSVAEAAVSVSAKLGVLSEKAGNINQVVTTITKVADQTNLLSLNAAIEAEKAGEAGRGFAVVATEIRRLADQTAVATYDIEQTVKEMQSAVAAGVMSMDKFSEQVRQGLQEIQQIGAQLSQIIQQVQTLAPRFVAVNEGMQAQAVGAEQISNALTQLTEASQQTVQSLQQSNDAIGGLNHVANALRSAVSRFRLA